MQISNTRKNEVLGHAAHAKARLCIYDYSPQMKTIFRALERIEFMANHRFQLGVPTGCSNWGIQTEVLT
jgi:hypothetical protein